MEGALQKSKKPYKLIPVRFVEEGGTKIGHTVIMNWDAKVRDSVSVWLVLVLVLLLVALLLLFASTF